MNQQLFIKPKDMKYTEMCIEIDTHFYDSDCDYNKMYTYMWCIAYMLACKKQYFNNANDYEEFASFLAYSTYQRMIDPDKVRVKSVLNYMKSILYFRKAAYEGTRHQQIINPEYDSNWDVLNYEDRVKTSLEISNRDRVVEAVNDVIRSVPLEIKKNIPRVYKGDRLMCKNIYMSALFSLLNKFTLTSIASDRLEARSNNPTFNEVTFYQRNLNDDIVLWHLPQKMIPVINVILNKVNKYMIDEIKGISDDMTISNDTLKSIVSSGFIVNGSNNETNN